MRGNAATSYSYEIDSRTHVFKYTIFLASNILDRILIYNGYTNY